MPRGDLPSQYYVTGIMDITDIGENERNLDYTDILDFADILVSTILYCALTIHVFNF